MTKNSNGSMWAPLRLLAEISKSIRDFGIVPTLEVALSRAADVWCESKFGVDTIETVEKDDLDVEEKRRSLAQRYQPTGWLAMPRILSWAKASKDSVLVDFGCGKGRVVMSALDWGLKKAIGLEISPSLAEIARNNLQVFKNCRLNTGEGIIETCDVLDYQFHGDETIFYFFHPFDQPVLVPLLDRIEMSLEDHPRKAMLIYYLGRNRDVFATRPAFKQRKTRRILGYPCDIYECG
jgi:hypothetical protein